MSQNDSVTEWIAQLKAGDPQASQRLWERYVGRLVSLARIRMGRTSRRMADEEDVALSAFDGFFRGVEEHRFPKLDDRDGLWQVLVMLTDRKAVDHRRRELTAKRGGGNVRGDSAFGPPLTCESHHPGLSQIIDNEPTPEFAAQFAEQFSELLALLGDDTLCRIALAKMEGYTNDELARDLGTSRRSIERKLHLIRRIWKKEGGL